MTKYTPILTYDQIKSIRQARDLIKIKSMTDYGIKHQLKLDNVIATLNSILSLYQHEEE
jgi:hypothetical protein